MFDPGPSSERFRAKKLKFPVISSAPLRDVRRHGRGPGLDDLPGGNINQDRRDVSRFGVGSQRVIEQLANTVRSRSPQFGDSAVTGEARRVTRETAQARMIRVLILDETGRKKDLRPKSPNDGGHFHRVRRLDLQARVPIQFDEFNGGAEQLGSVPRLCLPLFGCSVGPRFTARANHEMDRPSGLRFQSDDSAAAEFNIIRMRAEGQQRPEVSL